MTQRAKLARGAVRSELAAHMPRRIAALPIDARGYPVPWFVQWFDGKPDFRVVDSMRMQRAVRHGRCWICGQTIGVNKAFVIGPMCIVNRLSGEPPSHLDCATFAARFCPFLSIPAAHRREANLPAGLEVHGHMLPHNPGVTAVWVTREFRPEYSGGGVLFDIGEPSHVYWYCQGREATRSEVEAGFRVGIGALIEQQRQHANGASVITPEDAFATFAPYLPAPESSFRSDLSATG